MLVPHVARDALRERERMLIRENRTTRMPTYVAPLHANDARYLIRRAQIQADKEQIFGNEEVRGARPKTRRPPARQQSPSPTPSKMSARGNMDNWIDLGTSDPFDPDNEEDPNDNPGPSTSKGVGRGRLLKRFGIPSTCLLYTSPSPRDGLLSRMPSSA